MQEKGFNFLLLGQVSAYSLGGQGPWSLEFRGRTLDDSSQPPQLLWATEKEVLLTDLAGTRSTIFISQETHAVSFVKSA